MNERQEGIVDKAIQIHVGNTKQEWIVLANSICINNGYLGSKEALKIKFKR